jgi:hypothetical protein
MATKNSIDSGIPIEVSKGGTNATSIANTNGVVFFDGTKFTNTIVGVAAQVLTSNGIGVAPTFEDAPQVANFISLPTTTTISSGTIQINSSAVLHSFGGSTNIFVGSGAGNFALTGGFNTGCGAGSMAATTTGGGNLAAGNGALASLNTGSDNTAVGYLSMQSATSGERNSCYGKQSGKLITTGGNNVSVGHQALDNLVTGSLNIAIGANSAGTYNAAETSNICIGNIGVTGDATKIRIGPVGSISGTFIAGIRGITTGIADGLTVLVDSASQLGTISSSERFKENISDMGESSNGLMGLRPVRFIYKSDKDKNIQYGLIAEEVEEIYPELVAYEDGKPFTIKYHLLYGMLLNEIQKNRKLINQIASLTGVSDSLSGGE